MPYEVLETNAVRGDLNAALDYLEFVLSEPSSAKRLAEAYLDFLANAGEFPFMYPEVRERRLSAVGYRKAALLGYIALYKVELGNNADSATEGSQGGRVVIARLFHQSQDYARLL